MITFVYGDDIVEYMSLFTADQYEGRQVECDEGILQWVDKDDIGKLNISQEQAN